MSTPRVSKQKRLGLALPPSIIKKRLKKQLVNRKIRKDVSIYITAILGEAATRLLLSSAVHVTKTNFIQPKHLYKGLAGIQNVFPKNITGLY
jgi:hypothetical protein